MSSPDVPSSGWLSGMGNTVLIWSGLGVAFLYYLYSNQNRMLYHPVVPNVPTRPRDMPAPYRSPADFQLPYNDVRVVTEDGVSLHGWMVWTRD